MKIRQNMGISNFVKKPFLAIVVVIFVVGAILYIESQKPKIDLPKIDLPKIDLPKIDLNIKNTEEAKKKSEYPIAPDFVGIERWINSEPLTIEQLRGKVVLVDFWTYTCINCIRTLPYLKEWDKKYRDEGLVIIGVHTPEFKFEEKYENVLKAVNDYQLKYPVAQDNKYATWNSYQNRYWPHKYLIDADGYIRYDHIGEGAYEDTEKMIQSLLKERMQKLNQKSNINLNIINPEKVTVTDVNLYKVRTPEIYFGYQFSRGNFGNLVF